MPTLFRFLMIVGAIAGVITGSLYVLAEYFQPEPKEISKALRNVKGRLDETTAATPSVERVFRAPRAVSFPKRETRAVPARERLDPWPHDVPRAGRTPRSLRSSSTC
jgi:hypothetical protein